MTDANLANMCRACGKVTKVRINLFSWTSDLPCKTLAEAFTICTGLLLQPNPQPSASICIICVTELKYAYKFYEKCQRTNDVFIKFEVSEEPKLIEDSVNMDSHHDLLLSVDTKLEDGSHEISLPAKDIPAKKEIECYICNKKFRTKSALKKHSQRQVCSNNVNQTREKCYICKKILKTRDSLRTHMQLHDGKLYTCTVCGKSFPQMRYLKTHKLVHEDDKWHECKNCNAVYTLNSSLRRHLRTKKDCRLVYESDKVKQFDADPAYDDTLKGFDIEEVIIKNEVVHDETDECNDS